MIDSSSNMQINSNSNNKHGGKKGKGKGNQMGKGLGGGKADMEVSSSSSIERVPVGLTNMGNTCYMNAALQCLARTKIFINKLEAYGDEFGLRLQVNGEDNDIQITKEEIEAAAAGENPLDPSSSSLFGEYDNDSTNLILRSLEGNSSNTSENENDSDNSENEPAKDKIVLELKSNPLLVKMRIPSNSMHNHIKRTLSILMREGRNGNGSPPSDESSNNIMGSFYNNRNSYRPDEVQEKLSKYFRLGLQHDSHEFLRTLLDAVKKEQIRSFRLSIMNNYGVKKHDSNHPKAGLIKDLDRKFYHKTFVDEVFGGKLVSIQQCLKCMTIRYSFEKFLDLSLPIRVREPSTSNNASSYISSSIFDDHSEFTTNETIEQCFNAFTRPEHLFGANQVECENCHKQTLLIKQLGDEEEGKEKDAAASGFDDNFVDAPESNDAHKVKAEEDEEMMDSQESTTITTKEVDPPQDAPPQDEGFSEGENSSSLKSYESSSSSGGSPRQGGPSTGAEEDEEASMSSSLKPKVSSSSSSKKKPVKKAKIPITKCPCSRKQMIATPPEFLTVHLKRFQISYRGYTQKVQDHVDFKTILDLTPFCEEGARDEDGQVIYSLYGFVEHSGSLHWGHYVAYVRTESLSDSWYHISDSSYHPTTLNAVLRRDPYILFYQRVRGEEKARAVEAMEAYNNSTTNINGGADSSAILDQPTESEEPSSSSSPPPLLPELTYDSNTTVSNYLADNEFGPKPEPIALGMPMELETGNSGWGTGLDDNWDDDCMVPLLSGSGSSNITSSTSTDTSTGSENTIIHNSTYDMPMEPEEQVQEVDQSNTNDDVADLQDL